MRSASGRLVGGTLAFGPAGCGLLPSSPAEQIKLPGTTPGAYTVDGLCAAAGAAIAVVVEPGDGTGHCVPPANASGGRPAALDKELSMQRYASVIRLLPEKEAEYRALHADAWPGVLAALAGANVRNYSIFLRDGLLFSYLEYTGDDYAADMARIAEDPDTQRWWQLTDPCQQPVDSSEPGEWWAALEEVFHMD